MRLINAPFESGWSLLRPLVLTSSFIVAVYAAWLYAEASMIESRIAAYQLPITENRVLTTAASGDKGFYAATSYQNDNLLLQSVSCMKDKANCLVVYKTVGGAGGVLLSERRNPFDINLLWRSSRPLLLSSTDLIDRNTAKVVVSELTSLLFSL